MKKKKEALGVILFSWNEFEFETQIVLLLAASHAVGCIQGP